ncbi:hypothetical protein N1031_09720 [Herbiconiux moechotypicola]|uniref:TfoX N-terminal domain-containing protein n=1 Tax=Herbiconiux moechotypicola TaxID=637393 RepID=A0ABP5QFS4_9MICO|nr:hypothetical protein [Herbiconiux moechotypicola]MCS5730038.1 hypothetical protein [Herbiconiux moechotypicola]
MAAPVPSEQALALFDRVAAELGDPAITRGRMMGRPILSRAGTMFACLNGESIGLKLGAGTPEHSGALAVPGAELFDPGGAKRPFKDWVSLPVDSGDEWVPFAVFALAYVASA